jgi:hypothetical protein
MLALASGVVVTTEPMRALFADQLPAARIGVLPAGVEPAELPPPPTGAGLVLLHAGNVYGPRTSILPLMGAIESHRAQHPAQLIWYGEIRRREEREAVVRVADRYAGRVPYRTVSRAEAEANVIVVFGNHGGLQIPAKLWRAAGTGRRVLAVAADPSDALRTVEGLPGLRIVENREALLGDALESLAREVAGGSGLDGHACLGRHSWSARAADLEARVIDAVEACRRGAVGGPAPAAPSGAALIRRHTRRMRFRLDRKLKNARIVPPQPWGLAGSSSERRS